MFASHALIFPYVLNIQDALIALYPFSQADDIISDWV